MSIKPGGESRKHREELTKQAIADIVRAQILDRRFRKTTIARVTGISESYLRSLLRAEKQMSLFIFLELSAALGFDDPSQLLRNVLDRRDQLARKGVEGPIAE
jgi:AraC-like DNA-binding protein